MGWSDEAHKAIDEFTKNLKDRLIYGTKTNRDAIKDAAGDVEVPDASAASDALESSPTGSTSATGFKKAVKRG